jgi:5-methylcytosine-specific restriction endonuclease McrA
MRQVKEWVGKTDDTPAPPRVRDRVYERERGLCHKCRRFINAQGGERWVLEHLIALANGGENRESNLACTCENCLPAKNAEDMKIKKRGTQSRYRARGIRTGKSSLRARGPKWSAAQGRWVERSH